MPDIGTYYTLPVIPSFQGIDAQINKGFGAKFDAASKKAGKVMGQNVADGVKQAEAAVKASTDKIVALQDKQATAADKVRLAEEKLAEAREKGVTGSKLTAASNAHQAALRAEAAAVRNVEGEQRTLQAAQQALGGSTDSLGGKFSGLSGLAGKAGESMTAAGVVAAGAAVAGIAALAAGVVLAGKALYDFGADFDDISDSFVIKLGATGDKLAGLNKQVTDLGPTLALPLKDIGDIVGDVNRHLTGSTTELENVSQAVGDLNRMTGTSTDLHKFGQLIAQWNIPAKDQVKTLDLLFNASRKAGAPVNDLMEALTGKGAVALRELNIPLDEAAGLMLKFQETGLDAAGSVDALSKAQKASAKDGKDLNAELTDTFNQIKNAPSDNLADKVGFATFGKSAGQITEAIRDGSLSLKDFFSVMEAGGPTIAETAAATDDFAEKWQKLQNRLEVAIQPVASAVFDQINSSLSDVSDWATSHQDDVIRIVGRLGTGLLEVGKDAITFAEGVLGAFKKIIEGYNDLPWPFGPDKPIDTSFIDTTISSLDGVKDKLSGAEDWWKGFTDRAAEAVQLTQSLGDKVRATVNEKGEIVLSADDSDVDKKLADLGIKVKNVDGVVTVSADTAAGQKIIDAWRAQQATDPAHVPVQPRIDQQVLDQQRQMLIDAFKGTTIPVRTQIDNPNPAAYTPPPGFRPSPGRAKGGVLPGYSPGRDNMLVPMSGGEGVIVPPVMKALGPAWLAKLNSGQGYAGGGIVGLDALYSEAQALQGRKYNMNTGDDCSGTWSQLINAALGLDPKADRMSTATAANWITSKGGVLGVGPPGTLRVGWKNGGPGGGHMAGTLPDGTNVEMGGASGGYTLGGAAKGANDPEFTDHAYIPLEALYPDGVASGSATSPYGASATSGGSYSAPDAKAVREANQKVTDADTRVKQAEDKQKELKADAKQSEKDKAQSDVDKAKREAADAKSDLAELQKGKFTPGKAGKSGQGGAGQFGPLGDILGGAFKETLGFDGSFLPDLSSLGVVQGAGNFLNAFKGPLQGAVDGGLGIQQPGWSPGMPVNGVANDTGIDLASTSPFGSSATQVPAIVDPMQPGSSGPVSISHDNSITVNSPTGDPADIEKRIRNANNNRPRINTYAPPGLS